jgi:hypothetical protein
MISAVIQQKSLLKRLAQTGEKQLQIQAWFEGQKQIRAGTLCSLTVPVMPFNKIR